MTKQKYNDICEKSLALYEKAYIVLTDKEKASLEVVDFALDQVEKIGLEIITYVNTEKCCAKEMVMLPNQTCAEHRHPPIDGHDGKEETFRVRMGVVYLYVEGEPTQNPKAQPPAGSEQYFTARHEIVLHPGEQYTIYPNTLHWFQSGDEGAVVSEFSTKSLDEFDIFTDPRINRMAELED